MLLVVLGTLDQPSPSIETILERLHASLIDYEPKLSELIADEALTQSGPTPPMRSEARPQRRRLTSDVAFPRLPGDGPWVGYRHVREVDGRPLPGQSQERLQTLLAGGQDEQQRAIDLAHESARFNLGSQRTTNMPTPPLELLHPRHCHRFNFQMGDLQRLDTNFRRFSTSAHIIPQP